MADFDKIRRILTICAGLSLSLACCSAIPTSAEIALGAAGTVAAVPITKSLAGSPAAPAQPAQSSGTDATAQDIAALCVGSGLFKSVTAALGASVPIGALPAALIDAGVDKVCANPAEFAAIDGTIRWLIKNGLGRPTASITSIAASRWP